MRILYLATAAALIAAPAIAQRSRTVAVDTPRFEGETVVTRGGGSVSRDASLTRKSDGATATRSYDRQRNGTGVSASGSSTGFGGRSSSFDYERVRDGQGGYTASGTRTRRNGDTYTLEGAGSRTPNSYTRSRVIRDGSGTVVHQRAVTGTRQPRRRL